MSIETNNFKLYYKEKKYDFQKNVNNNLIIELYRSNLYNKLSKKLLDKLNKYQKDNIILSNELALDILSMLIFNHTFKKLLDPLFDIDSPFTKDKIINYIIKRKCISYFKKSIIGIIIKIYPTISKYYIKYYNRIKKNINKMNEIDYKISYEIISTIVVIKLKISNNILELKYREEIKIPFHIFSHLTYLYNINMLKLMNTKDVVDNKVIECIYILFNRYHILSSGNNQSSILPSFKKLLKEKLNIKIELFGSSLNTSNTIFGSFFYDCEYIFGSVGNYFDTKLKRGYYEINPIFDKCIIDNVFKKSLDELIEAKNEEEALLFCYIIPESYLKTNKLPDKINEFLTYNILLEKKKFPYIRYNRTFNKTVVSPIVNTHIIICNTTYINNYVKINLNNFNELLIEWINKIKK
jgi:hypothetical protein